jgi:hypothetical protein
MPAAAAPICQHVNHPDRLFSNMINEVLTLGLGNSTPEADMSFSFQRPKNSTPFHQILLEGDDWRSGLTPMLGIDIRDSLVCERQAIERRVAGQKLQSICALLACIEAYYQQLSRGEITRDELVSTVWETIKVIQAQTVYDEAEVLKQY